MSVVENRRRTVGSPDRVFGSDICSSGLSSTYMGLAVDSDRGSWHRDHGFVLGSGDRAVGSWQVERSNHSCDAVLRDSMGLFSVLDYGLRLGLEQNTRHHCSRYRHQSCLGILFDLAAFQSGSYSQIGKTTLGPL